MDESSRRRCALEIKLLSSKDLKAFNFFQKLSVYALVSLQGGKDPDNKKSLEINRTPTDGEGDGNPEWNHEMRFEFELKDCDGLFIHFDLRHEGLGLLGIGDRSIGEVRVPLKDLIISLDNNKFMEDDHHHPEQQQQQQQHKARYVNYQVTTSDEKANGILNFSYKLIKLNNIKEGISGGDDRPRIQYPTVKLEDDDISSKFNFNTTQVCYPAASSQSQTSLMELQQTPPHTSTATSASSQLFQQEFSVASSAVPPHRVSSQSPSHADHQIPICCWSPQYHQDHDDDDIHLKYHYPPPPPPPSVHAYYPSPPPPPPPPPPMSVRGESHYPPPPGHGMFRPCPSHPYHDYGPWSPANNNGPRHPHEHGHRFF